MCFGQPVARRDHDLDPLGSYPDEERARLDRACPVSCGLCCRLAGRSLEDGTIRLPGGLLRRLDPARYVPCEHLGSAGCRLPRLERPAACTGWLCRLSREVRDGFLGLDLARSIASGTPSVFPWDWTPPSSPEGRIPDPSAVLCGPPDHEEGKGQRSDSERAACPKGKGSPR